MPVRIEIADVDLREEGPRLLVWIHVPSKMQEAGAPRDNPRQTLALIDTACHTTIIKPEIAELLELKSCGVMRFKAHTGDIVEAPSYCVDIEFRGSDGHGQFIAKNVHVGGVRLPENDTGCLLGRDVLQYGVFGYDGVVSAFTLAFEE